jgi:hypothetical protein
MTLKLGIPGKTQTQMMRADGQRHWSRYCSGWAVMGEVRFVDLGGKGVVEDAMDFLDPLDLLDILELPRRLCPQYSLDLLRPRPVAQNYVLQLGCQTATMPMRFETLNAGGAGIQIT